MFTFLGDAARAVVVCIHSSGASSRQWQALKQRVVDRFDVIAPDLCGHGDGPAWLGEAGGILAADCARIARIAGTIPGGVHLVGHSYGAAVALRVAVLHPECVRSVVAYEPVAFRLLRDLSPRSQPAAEIAAVATAVRRELRAGRADAAARRFVDYWAGSGSYAASPPERQRSIASRMEAIGAHFTALWNDVVRLDDYAALDVPVQLLMGAKTRTPMRRIMELLRFALPHATYAALPGIDHMGPITNAALVADRIAWDLAGYEIVRTTAAEALAA